MHSRSLTQQLFAEFLITTIVLGLFSTLFIPTTARAGQPVFEINPTLVTDSLNSTLKEMGLDGIAFAISSALLNNIANQTLAWVQSGQAPSFVLDWQGFLAGAGQLAYTSFINQYFLPQILPNVDPAYRGLLQSYIQSPFNPLDVDLSRLTQNTLQAYGVTPRMVTTYAHDFQAGGGWQTFKALQDPNNNFYSIYLNTLNAQSKTIANTIEANKTQGIASAGFVDKRDPLTGDTKTPGVTIRDQLNNSIRGTLGKIESADELAEIITTFLLASFNRILSQGLQ